MCVLQGNRDTGTGYLLLNSFVNVKLLLKIKFINNTVILKDHERHSWIERKRVGTYTFNISL